MGDVELTIIAEPLTISSGDLRLEALLERPTYVRVPNAQRGNPDAVPGVVICHPHPRQGGNMYSGVVIGVADRLTASGFAVLRFNFRGVGESEGEFAWGSGETDDAEAAVETLSLVEGVDASRIGIAGYSFGAAVALQAAMGSSSIQAVASIACPAAQLRAFSGLEMLQPKLFVLGDHDHNFPADQFRFLTRRYADPCKAEIITGSDHFFRGAESEVGELASRFFTTWLKR